MTMPLFFASSALYPVSMMPKWLQYISHANPLTYQVDGLRTLMLAGSHSVYGLGLDFGVLIVASTAMVMLTGKLYAGIVT